MEETYSLEVFGQDSSEHYVRPVDGTEPIETSKYLVIVHYSQVILRWAVYS